MAHGSVCTIGTFDMLHMGHVELFRYCHELASKSKVSRVIVGVNSDGFILRYKGSLPVVGLDERMALIKACRFVDDVDVNPQDALAEASVKSLLSKHHVRILVVGSDWAERDYLAQIGLTPADVEELKLEIVYKPYHQGVSTTELKNRILSRSAENRLPTEGRGTLAVVPAYNPSHLLREAVQLLDNYVVVDNGSTDFRGYEGVKNIDVNMFGPSYEAGALLHAFTKYRYDRYLLIQDSLVLKDDRFVTSPASFFGDQPGIYALASIHPARIAMKPENFDWIREHFPEAADSDFNFPGIQYNSFSASHDQIRELVDHGLLTPERLPRNKAGSESWERMFGLLFLSLGETLHFLTTVSNTNHPVFTKTFLYRH